MIFSCKFYMFFVSVCLPITWAAAQNGRGPQHLDHNGHGWDIRLAVPGEPGSDYPTLGAIPRTSFSCAGRDPGYYADLETSCQVFRVCTVGSTYGFQSFLCPNGTLFNQAVFVCDWWMNVDCKNSQQFFSNNNEKFENLRLGPQLMKDIKKMLTHPMLNPYDKNAMKSNLIVMQDYKPPIGQLFPNGALLAGPERAPNNVYVPAKQIQQNLVQGNQNDYAFSASTPDPRYIPSPQISNFLPLQSNAEVFQRQRQNEQYNNIQNVKVQTTQTSQTGNIIHNGHAARFTQNTNTNYGNNNGLPQAQLPRPTQVTNNFSQRQISSVNSQSNNQQNFQRAQVNRPRAQYTEPRKLPQTNNDATYSRIQNNENINNNQGKQPYTYSTPSTNLPQFSNNVNNPAGKELKQNLALVYSFLTDSLNVAREYNNIAQQEILSSTVAPTPAQQNLNNEDLSQITNKISQLTSSQYSSNAKYTNEQNPARLMQTNQLTQSQTKAGQTQGEFYSSRYQIPNGQQNPVSSQNQLYSGQLYQWNVPDVTSQIYNSPNSANLVNPNKSQQTTQMFSVQRSTNQDNVVNSFKSSPQFEVIKANTIALNPAKLQLEPPNEPEQFNGQESFKSLFNSGNGISAHLEDKIVGTIPHPLEDNKLLTYKKDQSYFVYTKLDDNTIEQNTQTNEQTNTNNNQNAKLINNGNNIVSYQLIPSVSYELEDEKEQQQILNAFQIDEFGAPRDVIKEKPDEKQNQGERIATSRIDYSVEHPSDDKQSEQYNINPLYSGPSSYTAPQSSVGSLPSRQVVQNNFISRLEDFESNNNNGYSKDRPARQFFFK
ncbi:putative uncharacterized protein DDB_G0277255 isoform X2 [Trichoplusia ni]|uniref:Chitin-binding type-2 domain-containing protein n=1 Tax=Trichoplusia ni TaxID=7111 RepID=A0A7E5WLY2_TRINI|nr:putative uncharacterized protein DDB_G0277255 isoform X2 [Trichoplusia ni]